MQRFQLDRPIMVKRWRQEWNIHGRDFGDCHCGAGMGTMRKHRPRESHPSSSCGLCSVQRFSERMDRRRERYTARGAIIEGFADAIKVISVVANEAQAGSIPVIRSTFSLADGTRARAF